MNQSAAHLFLSHSRQVIEGSSVPYASLLRRRSPLLLCRSPLHIILGAPRCLYRKIWPTRSGNLSRSPRLVITTLNISSNPFERCCLQLWPQRLLPYNPDRLYVRTQWWKEKTVHRFRSLFDQNARLDQGRGFSIHGRRNQGNSYFSTYSTRLAV